MLILEKGEVCPYANICPHNDVYALCYGARAERNNKFTCDLVVDGKIVKEGTRLSQDQTGKMKVIME